MNDQAQKREPLKMTQTEAPTKIRVDAAILHRALRGVFRCVSYDDCRPSLCGIELHAKASGYLSLSATDGYRAAKVMIPCDVTKEVRATLHRNEVKRLRAMLPKTVVSLSLFEGAVTYECTSGGFAFDATEGAFPPMDRVIPNRTDEESSSSPVGINPVYLAEAAQVVVDVFGKATAREVMTRLQCSGKLQPIRLDAQHNGIEVLVIVMPVRL